LTTNYECKRVDIKPISETSDLYYDFICYKNEKPVIIRFTYNNQDGGYFDGVIEITQYFVKQYFTPDKKSNEENIETNLDSDYNSIKDVVQSWNKTHQNSDFTAMQNLYSNKVFYYGQEMASKDIVTSKQSFMKKYKDFNQNIEGDLNIEYLDKNKMKVSFIKQASFGGKHNEYPSYLEVEKTNSEWKICTESDDITDKNLAKRNENKVSSNGGILKRTYVKNNNVFVEFANNNIKQLTYNGKDSDPIIINANTIFFVRKQYDIDDNEVNVFMTIEVGMLKEKVIKTLDSYFTVEKPKLSNDKKHIFYYTNLYATSVGVVKLNIFTGESKDLFACDWYQEITSGDFKGYFLNYTYGFKDGQLGRQYYYRLCNSNGAEYLTFENEASMNDFAKANNINL
jgi:ketosteroid isomerase-like protein